MRRPRKGAKSQPTARHPSQRPPVQAILAERSIVLAVLIASGVPARDRPDVEQDITIGAWRSIERGMYRPDPADEPRKALRGWIHGIAWRKVSHYFGNAWVRRAVLQAEPLGLLRELAGPSLHAQVEARETLEALADLPLWLLEALLAVDEPEPLTEYARRRGLNPHTVASRLRIARAALAVLLRKRGQQSR
ncbi:sigma-70 family RNA polymerase sigma factor [Sorangium sp. So ce1153]|uniref:sigma-70 family RNA polymerase sigma factor n=1 Tax=Sorangium sp. So ce1153 TaxID=3133333 RepID=UPI003F613F54